MILVATLGCSFQSVGTGDDSPLVADDTGSGSADTAIVADSAVVDEGFSPDTTPAVDSTLPVDTGTPPPVDTGTSPPTDTGTPPPDTTVVDTGPEAAVDTGTGFLSCEAAAPSSVDVNLTTEGTLDWAHWGYLLVAANWNHKSGANEITKGMIGGALPFNLSGKFSWSDGTPTGSSSGTNAGVYQNAKNEKYTFDIKGDPLAERVAVIYATWSGASGTFDAKLSDASAAPVAASMPPSGVSTGTGIRSETFTCRFRPVKADGKLQITITQTSSTGYIGLQAASLH